MDGTEERKIGVICPTASSRRKRRQTQIMSFKQPIVKSSSMSEYAYDSSEAISIIDNATKESIASRLHARQKKSRTLNKSGIIEQIESLKQELTKKDQDYQTLLGVGQMLLEKNKELTQMQDDLRKEYATNLSQRDQQISELKQVNDKVAQHEQELTDQLKSLHGTVSSLQSGNVHTEHKVFEMYESYSKMEEELKLTKQQLNVAKQKNKELLDEFEKCKLELEKHQSSEQDLRRKLRSASTLSTTENSKQIDERDEYIARLEEELKQYSRHARKLESAIEEMQQENDRIRAIVDQSDEIRDRLEETVEILTKTNQELKQQFEDNKLLVLEKQDIINQLESQIEEMNFVSTLGAETGGNLYAELGQTEGYRNRKSVVFSKRSSMSLEASPVNSPAVARQAVIEPSPEPSTAHNSPAVMDGGFVKPLPRPLSGSRGNTPQGTRRELNITSQPIPDDLPSLTRGRSHSFSGSPGRARSSSLGEAPRNIPKLDHLELPIAAKLAQQENKNSEQGGSSVSVSSTTSTKSEGEQEEWQKKFDAQYNPTKQVKNDKPINLSDIEEGVTKIEEALNTTQPSETQSIPEDGSVISSVVYQEESIDEVPNIDPETMQTKELIEEVHKWRKYKADELEALAIYSELRERLNGAEIRNLTRIFKSEKFFDELLKISNSIIDGVIDNITSKLSQKDGKMNGLVALLANILNENCVLMKVSNQFAEAMHRGTVEKLEEFTKKFYAVEDKPPESMEVKPGTPTKSGGWFFGLFGKKDRASSPS